MLTKAATWEVLDADQKKSQGKIVFCQEDQRKNTQQERKYSALAKGYRKDQDPMTLAKVEWESRFLPDQAARKYSC